MIDMNDLKGKWEEVKAKLSEKWGQLTDEDLKEFNGEADQLIGLIHRKTGEGYEAVEEYLQELGKNMSSTLAGVTEYAAQAAKTVRHSTKQAAQHMHTCCEETKRMVHEKPLRALALFFGIGLVSGVIYAKCKRSK